jgi:hypothetical protein
MLNRMIEKQADFSRFGGQIPGCDPLSSIFDLQTFDT